MNQDRPGILPYVLTRVIVPLACGAIGGLVALAFHSPAPAGSAEPSADCKNLAEQVAALQAAVTRSGLPREQVVAGAPAAAVAAPQNEQAKQFADGLVAEAKKAHEEFEAKHAEREARQADRIKTKSEVELVKLRNLQNTLSLEQTRENVVRRLKRLAIPETDVVKVGDLAAPYIRQRSDVVIKFLEKASSGQKVTEAEVNQQLRPLDEHFSASLPSNLDELTRRAIATELKSMVDVPYFLKDF